jgi:3-oxoacyl-(acyl-carrier-protein) synthase
VKGRGRAFVTGLGAVCAPAANVPELMRALGSPVSAFHGVTLFPVFGDAASLPVGEVAMESVPRTHALALHAAREAIGTGPLPDAIVLGTTTGGIDATEEGLEHGSTDPDRYRKHGLDTVAASLAAELGVRGPVITLSSACSSSAVAIAIARELVLAGLATRVLAGGADALCRLTFHGFRLLQLVAAGGARPLSADRTGMTLGEGAAFVVIESAPAGSRPVLAEIAGSGLSCDAYHATKPHPEGLGAALAMSRALDDAQVSARSVDYVNLHGTGTVDNDASEVRAIRDVFGADLPSVSSTKGLTGHALGAAGAIEAVISVLAIARGIIPANVGFQMIDPVLGVEPVRRTERCAVRTVVSNSFGFGGNNASLVFREAQGEPERGETRELPALRVIGSSCLSGRGAADATWEAWNGSESTAGTVPDASFAADVAPAVTRRLKRLSRIVLALASGARRASGSGEPPAIISVGTGWGGVAETHDFLRKLFESGETLSSPTDFIGSVHNAPAGQAAMLLGARGANLTCSSGDRSFEHAVLCASLLIRGETKTALIVGADGWHDVLSPLLDAESAAIGPPSDGGAAFVVSADDDAGGVRLRYLGEEGGGDAAAIARLIDRLGGAAAVARGYGLVLAGVSPRGGEVARTQYADLERMLARSVPLKAYRDTLGQYATASAAATAMAVRMVQHGSLAKPKVLLVSLGAWVTAMEVFA